MKRTVSLLTITLLLVSMFTAAFSIRAAGTGLSPLTVLDEPATMQETINLASQEPPLTEWNKTYGGTSHDYAWGLVQTVDGGYALAGYTYSFGAGYYDFWLVKTDSAGNMQWNKTYGGTNSDWAYALVQTSDGGYAIAGYTDSFGAGLSDFWLVKTDSAGNMQWNKTYGGIGGDCAYALVQTSDGGYALAGVTFSFGAGDEDLWLVKADAAGNMEWNKTYGGTYSDGAWALVQTVDGGYALAGYTYFYGAGGYDFWLVKTDSAGNMQWNKTYGGTGEDKAFALVQTVDGGYALAGRTSSFGAGSVDFWLVKTDAAGNMQWNKTYGGTSHDDAWGLVQTVEGGYALAGVTYSFGAGNGDFWLVKTDAAGNAQWNKTYGGTNKDWAYAFVQTVDGGYALAGYTYSFGAGSSDFWLVKTAPDSWAGGTIYIRADGSIDPPTAPIQRDGDQYTLTGNITVDAEHGFSDGIVVEKNNIVIDGNGFTLQGAQAYLSVGILLDGRENVTIRNTRIEAFYDNVYLASSSKNSIIGNNLTYSVSPTGGDGIHLVSSSNNTIRGNNITYNQMYGIWLFSSSNYNSISGNSIMGGHDSVGLWDNCNYNSISGNGLSCINGIGIGYSNHNNVSANNVTSYPFGISLTSSGSNRFWHNNMYNAQQVHIESSEGNIWDDGYPSGGNYWSDYIDVDFYSGPDQSVAGSDGIWDHPYIIDENNHTDRYPLVNQWSSGSLFTLSVYPTSSMAVVNQTVTFLGIVRTQQGDGAAYANVGIDDPIREVSTSISTNQSGYFTYSVTTNRAGRFQFRFFTTSEEKTCSVDVQRLGLSWAFQKLRIHNDGIDPYNMTITVDNTEIGKWTIQPGQIENLWTAINPYLPHSILMEYVNLNTLEEFLGNIEAAMYYSDAYYSQTSQIPEDPKLDEFHILSSDYVSATSTAPSIASEHQTAAAQECVSRTVSDTQGSNHVESTIEYGPKVDVGADVDVGCEAYVGAKAELSLGCEAGCGIEADFCFGLCFPIEPICSFGCGLRGGAGLAGGSCGITASVSAEATYSVSYSPLGTDLVGPLMILLGQCPIDMRVKDPLGREGGSVDLNYPRLVNLIPSLNYSGSGTHPQSIVVPTPIPGQYEVSSVGTGAGSYNITTQLLDLNGLVVDTVSWQGLAEPGATYIENLRLDPDGAIIVPHNIRVLEVKPSKTVSCMGETVSFEVLVENRGAFSEQINITAYANETDATVFRNLILDSRNSTVLILTWNTTGFAKGNYTISAYATPVQGETDTADNMFSDGWVFISIPGDINGDNIVDIFDVVRVALAFGAVSTDPNWDSNANINSDGIVDIFDLVVVALHFGETG